MDTSSQASTQKDLVRRHFDADSRGWQDVYSAPDLASKLIQSRLRKVMDYVDSLGLPRGARVLELGCGAGLTARLLLERGFRVTGVDIADAMVERARANCEGVGEPGWAEFRTGDAEHLDSAPASYDLIIAMGLIQYLEWDRWALQQMHRALVPGGHLIVTVPNQRRLGHLDPWYLAVQAKRLVLRRLRKLSGRTAPARQYFDRYYAPAAIRATLQSLGFYVNQMHTHGYGPFWTIQRMRKLSLTIDALCQRLREAGITALEDLGSDIVILCKALPSLAGLDAGRPFPDQATRRVRFEQARRPLVDRRDSWLAAHPEYRAVSPLSIDPIAHSKSRVLVLAPHADDEIIGCGGLLLKLGNAGARIAVAFATDGAGSAGVAHLPETVRRTIRIDHAKRVAKAAAFHRVEFWQLREGSAFANALPLPELLALLESEQPDVILLPFMTDHHPDHATMNRLLVHALETWRPPDGAKVLGYEVWSLAPATAYCELEAAEMRRKEQLLLMYATEMSVDDYVHTCESLQLYNADRILNRGGWAEGFFAESPINYARLARETLGLDVSVAPL